MNLVTGAALAAWRADGLAVPRFPCAAFLAEHAAYDAVKPRLLDPVIKPPNARSDIGIENADDIIAGPNRASAAALREKTLAVTRRDLTMFRRMSPAANLANDRLLRGSQFSSRHIGDVRKGSRHVCP